VCSSADRLGRRPDRLGLLVGLAADHGVAIVCADLVRAGWPGAADRPGDGLWALALAAGLPPPSVRGRAGLATRGRRPW
jgi:hypothetical protein